MNFINNISMGKKLIGAFLLSSLITAVVGGIGFFRISSNMEQVQDMVEGDLALLKNAEELEIYALLLRRYEKDFFLNIGKAEKQKGYVKRFLKTDEHTIELLEAIAVGVKKDPHLSPDVLKAVVDAKSSHGKYIKGFMGLTEVVLADSSITPQKANKLMDPFKSDIYKFEENVEHLLKAALSMVDSVTSEIVYTGGRSRIMIGVLLAAGIVVSVVLGIVLTMMITRPLNKAVMFADEMAQGDLSQQIDISSKDEIGQLMGAMNSMALNLRSMFQEVIQGSQTLTSSSTELSSVSEQILTNSDQTAEKSRSVAAAAEQMSMNMNGVSAATEETEASISMIVSAAEEMTSTINEIAQRTATGSEITQKAVAHASDVSEKVDELGRAAQEISKVTETIEDISEQTNLLALNATIEAARAGEAGKGFAVVAGEIKALAQQTADATSEISQKISGIQQSTQESVSAIGTITEVINEINEIVVTVATAIEEQSATTQEISNNVSQAASGVQEVNENISQASVVAGEVTEDVSGVSRAAEEINTGTGQVSQSAEELSRLAESLNEMVSRFKV